MRNFILISLILLIFTSCNQHKQQDEINKLKKENDFLRIKLNEQKNMYKSLNDKILYSRNSPESSETLKELKKTLNQSSNQLKIITTGKFHGDEIENNFKDLDWYGLFIENDKYFLKKTKIMIESVFDPIADSKGDKTGIKVFVPDIDTKPFILINGLNKIQEKQIESVKINKIYLNPGDGLNIEFNGDMICFNAYGSVYPDQGLRNYLIRVSSRNDKHKVKQVIAATDGFDDAMYKFIWAGDIDQDGKLDLIMDLSDHYNMSKITLFLSSMAEEGELFKNVAEFITVGC